MPRKREDAMRARRMADARTELTFLIRHRQDITRRDGARQSRPTRTFGGKLCTKNLPRKLLKDTIVTIVQ